MENVQKLIAGMLLLVTAGCVYNFKLVDMREGTTIIGEYNKASESVEVTLPSGEHLTGEYVALTNASISYGSLFSGTNVATAYGINVGGSSNGYALLTDGHGTVMEIIFQYSEWTGHGFGVAKTNKGKEYKIIF